MERLLETNDPVLLSYVCALLRDAHIDCHVWDGNMSVLEGSLGVLPRRVMVAQADMARAKRILAAARIVPEEE